MDRRAFLKSVAAGAMAATGGLATPVISQRAGARTLRFVPRQDLANFDPIWTPAYVVRNGGALVWDMLYGIDGNLRPQRQMIEAEEVSADDLVWTFRLRPGLKFHDGTPVLARDAVASLGRWSARDPMGLMIRAIQNELTVVNDRTFRWVLKKPYPKMLLALGKSGTPCFIMPERIATTDPFRQIGEYLGSGPMRFVKDEWVPGAKAVFERFADYVPRQEPASGLAGGKQILADRIEWVTKSPPGQGGWNMFHTSTAGAEISDPANNQIRANGDSASFGWPNNPQVEAEVAAWFDAKSLDDEKAVARRLNKAALDHVVYAPLGFYLTHQAWRRNVTGIVKGPLPFFWGVNKVV
jgi:ABC-type transport system substrate-binding protein